MKILVDQNVPVGLAAGLREAGFDADHTRERGLARSTDNDLLALARDEGRVVITFDSDFAQLIALSGARSPSVVHLRFGNLPADQVLPLVVRGLSETEGALQAGAIVSLMEHGYRLHPLPIER